MKYSTMSKMSKEELITKIYEAEDEINAYKEDVDSQVEPVYHLEGCTTYTINSLLKCGRAVFEDLPTQQAREILEELAESSFHIESKITAHQIYQRVHKHEVYAALDDDGEIQFI